MYLFCHSFDAKRPGVVSTHCDAEPIEYQLLCVLSPVDSSPVLAPTGLNRQAYLYEKIWPSVLMRQKTSHAQRQGS